MGVDSGNGYFEFSGNILTPEGRAVFNIVSGLKSDWDRHNQEQLSECPFRLRLDADDATLRGLYLEQSERKA